MLRLSTKTIRPLDAPKRAPFLPGLTTAAGALVLSGGPAVVQAQGATLEEVVVTAEKRESSLQDTPIAVSALSDKAIADARLTTFTDLQATAPNLALSENFGMAFVQIRGVGNTNVFAGSGNGVAFHIDGVVVEQPYAQVGTFFDLERIEIVRGPQGTLYGRNATGGSINLITKKPTRQFEGYGLVTLGNYDLNEIEGAVGGPVAGNWMGRIAFKSVDRNGYGRNEYNGTQVDDANTQSLRGQLLFDPQNGFTALLASEYHREHDANFQFHPLGPSIPGSLPLGIAQGGSFPVELRDMNSAAALRNDRQTWTGAVTLNWQMSDDWSLKSITGYRDFKFQPITDLDETELQLRDQAQYIDSKQLSQELQVNFTHGKWRGLGGLYYFDERLAGDNRAASNPTVEVVDWIQFRGTIDTQAIGVFGSLTYNMTDRLALTAGLRYSDERKEQKDGFFYLNIPGVFPPYPGQPISGKKSWNDFTPRVVLDYKLSDAAMLYASYSEGFKGGIILVGQPNPPVDPETLKAYEIGSKLEFLDRRVRLNSAVFLYKYRDQQVSKTTAFPVFATIYENAARSEIKGAELELVAAVTPQFLLSGNLGFQDAKFDEFESVNPNTVSSAQGNPVLEDLNGNRLLNAPKWNGTLRAEYTLPVERFKTTAAVEGVYTDDIFFDQFNEDRTRQPAVTRLDANVKLETQDGKLGVNFWGRNLTDREIYTLKQYSSSGGLLYGTFFPPRTYGVTLSYYF